MKSGREPKPSKGPFHWIGTGIRNLDVFGQPVQLKYKNRFESNSIIGGCFSIVFTVGIALYFALLIHRSDDFRAAKVTSVLEKRNIGMDPNRSLQLDISNFDIALGILYGGTNASITQANIDDFFTYKLNMIAYELFTDPAKIQAYGSTYRWDKTMVPLEVCDSSRFMGMTEITSNLGITDTYYCP